MPGAGGGDVTSGCFRGGGRRMPATSKHPASAASYEANRPRNQCLRSGRTRPASTSLKAPSSSSRVPRQGGAQDEPLGHRREALRVGQRSVAPQIPRPDPAFEDETARDQLNYPRSDAAAYFLRGGPWRSRPAPRDRTQGVASASGSNSLRWSRAAAAGPAVQIDDGQCRQRGGRPMLSK